MKSVPLLFAGGWGIPPAAYQYFCERLSDRGIAGNTVDYGFFGSGVHWCPPAGVTDAGTVLIGHSMGAPLCLHAARNPQIRAVVLINPMLRFTRTDVLSGWTMDAVEHMREGLRRNPESTLRAFYRNCAAPESFRINAGKPNPAALDEGLAYLEQCDAGEDIGQIHCPVLVLHAGKNDRVVTGDMVHDLLTRMPSAAVKEYPESGHLLPLTHPEELAQDIAAWLETEKES